MISMTLDDLTPVVVGSPGWAKACQYRGRPSQAFTATRVRVPAFVLTSAPDETDAHVVLVLDDGRRVEGHGMWRIGGMASDGYVASLRFEGDDVVEQL